MYRDRGAIAVRVRVRVRVRESSYDYVIECQGAQTRTMPSGDHFSAEKKELLVYHCIVLENSVEFVVKNLVEEETITNMDKV